MISWIANLVQKRGKIIFSILLVIIIVAFVFTQYSSFLLGGPSRSQNFYGIDLSSEAEKQALGSKTHVSLSLNGIFRYNDSQFSQEMLTRQVRTYLADLLSIPEPTDAELTEAIKAKPAFRDQEGKFRKNQMTAYIDSLPKANGMDEAYVIEVVKEDYRLQKLDELLATPGFILDQEVASVIAREQTTWTINVAEISYTGFKADTAIDYDTIATYYEDNKLAYQIPEQYLLTYVQIDGSAVNSEDLSEPTEEDINAFYFENRSLFESQEAKVKEAAGEDAEISPLDMLTKIRWAVEKAFVEKQKDAQAVYIANNFIAEIFDNDILYKSEAFNKLLEDYNLELQTSVPFAVNPNIQLPTALPQSIYQQTPRLTEKRYYSDVAANEANDKFFVAFLDETIAARIPELSEIRPSVVTNYLETQKQKAFAEKGVEMKTAFDAGDKTFAQVAEANGLVVTNHEPFKLSEKPADLNQGLLQAIESLNAGEISSMITIGEKGYFVEITAKNKPEMNADDERYAAISSSLEGYSGFVRYQAIISQLLDVN